MGGTRAGGRKMKATLLKKLGSEEAVHRHYQEMGRKGGTKSRGGGFASDKVGPDGLTGKERARIAGARGGSLSRRGPSKGKTEN